MIQGNIDSAICIKFNYEQVNMASSSVLYWLDYSSLMPTTPVRPLGQYLNIFKIGLFQQVFMKNNSQSFIEIVL